MSKPFENIGNYTTFPNEIIDEIMPKCAPNTWKILCVTIRKTIGWHKKQDTISITQYMKLSGIKNRRTCTKAIKEALNTGYLVRTVYRNGYKYALNTQYEMEDSTETVPVNSTETVPTKEKEKESNKLTQSEVRSFVSILAEVTGIDTKIRNNYSWLAREGKELSQAGYTADKVKEIYQHGGAWYKQDWRGQKGQKPTIKQIRETIKDLSLSAVPEMEYVT